MMEVRVPQDFWDEDIDGVIVTWLYDAGDYVRAGSAIAQIMVEKVQFDLVAPVAGLLQIEVAQESPVRKGDLVARIRETGE